MKLAQNRWTPGKNEITLLREILIQPSKDGKLDFIDQPHKINLFEQYFFQYIPYINNKNEKVVLVNSFCYNRESYEKEKESGRAYISYAHGIVSITHAGRCLWQLLINIENKNYGSLNIGDTY